MSHDLAPKILKLFKPFTIILVFCNLKHWFYVKFLISRYHKKCKIIAKLNTILFYDKLLKAFYQEC